MKGDGVLFFHFILGLPAISWRGGRRPASFSETFLSCFFVAFFLSLSLI
jgi:hypothetical protein